jgi:hypothetical protein
MERRERQSTPLWIFLLPICLALAVIAAQRRVDAYTSSRDALDASVTAAPSPIEPHPSATTPHVVEPVHAVRRRSRAELDASQRLRSADRGAMADARRNTNGERWQSNAMLLEDADEALRQGRTSDAFALASTCVRRDANDVGCSRVAAAASLREGRFDDARPFVDVCSRAPEDSQCLAVSAQLALHDRDLTLAGILSWRLSQLAPDSVDTLMARAQLSDLQGDHAAAERTYRRACEAGQSSACEHLRDLAAGSTVE